MSWTEERVAKLKELWPDPKMSCAAIGKEIGMGRNAVIGKAKRMDLGPKPSDSAHAPRRHSVPRILRRIEDRLATGKRKATKITNYGSHFGLSEVVVPEPFIPREVEAPPSLRLSILKVKDSQCKYIAGDDHLCCGHPVKEGKAYCQAHCAIVYVPVRERTEAQKAADVVRAMHARRRATTAREAA